MLLLFLASPPGRVLRCLFWDSDFEPDDGEDMDEQDDGGPKEGAVLT